MCFNIHTVLDFQQYDINIDSLLINFDCVLINIDCVLITLIGSKSMFAPSSTEEHALSAMIGWRMVT